MQPGAFEILGQRLQYEMLSDVANQAHAKWEMLAKKGLHTTRRDYLAGLQEVNIRQGVATISLVGLLPNLLEHGMDATDMHDTLLGPNVPSVPIGKRGKHPKKDGSGYYRAIPFRHATPGTTGAVGTPMGAAFAQHDFTKAPGVWAQGMRMGSSQEMGQNIYDSAKKLKATKGMPGGKATYGGRLAAGYAPKLKEHHATDIYAGMIKSQKKYVKATQSQYTTFRTISTGSPGWMRPATAALNYAEQVKQSIGDSFGATAALYLNKALKQP